LTTCKMFLTHCDKCKKYQPIKTKTIEVVTSNNRFLYSKLIRGTTDINVDNGYVRLINTFTLGLYKYRNLAHVQGLETCTYFYYN